VSCNRFSWLARSKPTSWAQASKRLVAYIEALLVLSPYWRPSYSRIVAIDIIAARDLILQHQTNYFTFWINFNVDMN
jgi:hypothetical protein